MRKLMRIKKKGKQRKNSFSLYNIEFEKQNLLKKWKKCSKIIQKNGLCKDLSTSFQLPNLLPPPPHHWPRGQRRWLQSLGVHRQRCPAPKRVASFWKVVESLIGLFVVFVFYWAPKPSELSKIHFVWKWDVGVFTLKNDWWIPRMFTNPFNL